MVLILIITWQIPITVGEGVGEGGGGRRQPTTEFIGRCPIIWHVDMIRRSRRSWVGSNTYAGTTVNRSSSIVLHPTPMSSSTSSGGG
jgi:hypothetical protein